MFVRALSALPILNNAVFIFFKWGIEIHFPDSSINEKKKNDGLNGY